MVSAGQCLISYNNEGELVLNSDHDLASIPSASNLGKMHSQDGQASNVSEPIGICRAVLWE